jgi:hypothetical protein
MNKAELLEYAAQRKVEIDALDTQLLNGILNKQQHIANMNKDSPNYQQLRDELIAFQRRRCQEPNELTYYLLECITKETNLTWDQVVNRNNDSGNRKGKTWAAFMLEGIN